MGFKIAPKSENESERLKALFDFNVLDTGSDTDLDDITLLATQICGTEIGLISLVDENRQWFKSKRGIEASETPRGLAFCSHAINESQVFIVEDALQDDRFSDSPLVTGSPKVRFYAGAQLKTSNGFNIGTLCVIDTSPRKMSAKQIKSLEVLAHQVIVNFENQKRKIIVKKRQKFLDSIFEMLPDLVAYVDSNFVYKFANSSYKNWFNQNQSQVIGKSVSEVLGQDAFRLARPFMENALKGEVQNYETALPYLIEGQVVRRFVIAKYIPDVDDEGKVVGFFALVTDVTNLKNAINEVTEREKAFRAIFENSPSGIIQVDMNWKIVASNLAYQQLIGYSEFELKGRSILDLTHPDDLEETKRRFNTFSVGQPNLGQFEKRYVHKSGKTVWVQFSSKLVEFQDSNEKFFFTVCEDITELVHKRNELKSAQEDLERERLKTIHTAKLASLGEVSAGIAHEINNPLAIISSAIAKLAEGKDSAEKIEGRIRMINKSVDRISKIVSGLRKFSRSGGNANLEYHRLKALVEEVFVMVNPKAKDMDTFLEMDIPDNLQIFCNEIEIQQVMVNLITNAVDAVQTSSEKWVKVNAFEKDGKIIFQVRDSGKGISKEVEDKLFQPFFTTKPVGQGTGLGLSISKGILDQHHASIAINRTDANTCFEIEFSPPGEIKKTA